MDSKAFNAFLCDLTKGATPIIDSTISFSKYIHIDLSNTNEKLVFVDLSDPYDMQHYIDRYLKANNASLAYGGYNEQRALYKSNSQFNDSDIRDIHLGIDFWIAAGTDVITPLDGEVHSFANNTTVGDYGPTIILKHKFVETSFYTLYGHLSTSSLNDLHIGKSFTAGTKLATLGTPEENVNYAPHLHFQIIRNLQGNQGDYPGVSAANDLEFYLNNCPDPNLLLKLD